MVHLLVMLLLSLLLSCFPFIPFHSIHMRDIWKHWKRCILLNLSSRYFALLNETFCMWVCTRVRMRVAYACMHTFVFQYIQCTLNANVQPKQYPSIDILTLTFTFTTHITRTLADQKHKIIYTNHVRFTYIAYTYAWKTLLFRMGNKWHKQQFNAKFVQFVRVYLLFAEKSELRIMQVNSELN